MNSTLEKLCALAGALNWELVQHPMIQHQSRLYVKLPQSEDKSAKEVLLRELIDSYVPAVYKLEIIFK